MNWLLSPPSLDDFLRLLRAWKFWLLFSVLGAILGAGAYFIIPPVYRAQATVVVDFNVEKSWTTSEDKEIFYYLERETRKLVEVAWADETIKAISAEMPDLTGTSLRQERLQLSQPEDGAWHFYADDPDPARAEKIVSIWAESFNRQVQKGTANALALNAIKTALENGKVTPAEVEEEIAQLEAESLGISAYIQTSLSQKESLPVSRTISLGTYIFFGTSGLLFFSALWILFSGKAHE